MIASEDKFSNTITQGLRTGSKTHDLVMVFKGQGTQWPRMGRELLLHDGLSLVHLAGPLKNNFLNRLGNQAYRGQGFRSHFSLPYTLLTSAFLHLSEFTQMGVPPNAARLNCSSVCFCYAHYSRGHRYCLAKRFGGKWTKPSCSQGSSRPCTRAGQQIPIAAQCHRSLRELHQSVTISDDAEEVQAAFGLIQQEHPTIIAILLKVDKAYHSYHMAQVGESYTTTLQKCLPGFCNSKSESEGFDKNLRQRPLFFSTADGTGEPLQADRLEGSN
ncbi:hypothetical protein CCHL11_09616 [Colletotrichum chlorophyti]|uniref:Uncharacterized protein n=1 Tax=Colletotrichum chlorophyti TaxID=708187 RepID=A0A1Q8RWQ7_9PEZI|nr:hypothetical protein CCHL11_09616 [Colletotrichum chlorophyti]